jgi:hypothetical protein
MGKTEVAKFCTNEWCDENVLYRSSELRVRKRIAIAFMLYSYQILQVLSFQKQLVVILLHYPTCQPSPPVPAGHD